MSEMLHLDELLPVMEEVLKSGGEFTFIPGGNSMRPMLQGKRDSVTITLPQGRLKKYDLPLYRRADGKYVLHRVIKVLPDGYVMRGDCTVSKEYGIGDENIIGVVKSFVRKGRHISCDCPFYKFYCTFWDKFAVLRRFIIHFGART